MCHIVICGLPRSTASFHIISLTARFSENEVVNMKCVSILSIFFSETFLCLRRIERDMIIIVDWSKYKVPLIFFNFNDS